MNRQRRSKYAGGGNIIPDIVIPHRFQTCGRELQSFELRFFALVCRAWSTKMKSLIPLLKTFEIDIALLGSGCNCEWIDARHIERIIRFVTPLVNLEYLDLQPVLAKRRLDPAGNAVWRSWLLKAAPTLPLKELSLGELCTPQVLNVLPTTLQSLQLSYTAEMGDEGCTALQERFSCMPHLKSISIDHTAMENRSIMTLVESMSSLVSLEELELRGFGRYLEPFRRVMNSLAAIPKGLKKLDLSCPFTIGLGGWEQLGKHLRDLTTLCELRLRNAGERGGLELSRILPTFKQLRVLELRGFPHCFDHGFGYDEEDHVGELEFCNIGLIACERLGQAMADNTTLEELSLVYNDLGWTQRLRPERQEGSGCAALFGSLRQLPALRRLNLSSSTSPLGRRGCAALGRALRSGVLSSLQALALDGCGITGSEFTVLCAGLAGAPRLEHLSVEGNAVGDSGCVSLTVAWPLLTALGRLSLRRNRISAAGFISVAYLLAKHVEGGGQARVRLTALDLGLNEPGVEGFRAMAEALRKGVFPALEELSLGPKLLGDGTTEGDVAMCSALVDALTGGAAPRLRVLGLGLGRLTPGAWRVLEELDRARPGVAYGKSSYRKLEAAAAQAHVQQAVPALGAALSS